MRRIKKGDNVIIITGKDKGKRGLITQVLIDDNSVVVTNLNMVKFHKKPGSHGESGGIVNKEMPIHVSNVALFNPQTGKPDRVNFKILEDGRKIRIFKSTKEAIDR